MTFSCRSVNCIFVSLSVKIDYVNIVDNMVEILKLTRIKSCTIDKCEKHYPKLFKMVDDYDDDYVHHCTQNWMVLKQKYTRFGTL